MRKRKVVEIEETIESKITNPEVLNIFLEAKEIMGRKKIIAPDVKIDLIKLGFCEVIVGCKKEHEITSKQVKINFHGYDIAIGLSPVAISYGCGRKYRALVIKCKE